MNYLVIKNSGIIDPKALHLVGAAMKDVIYVSEICFEKGVNEVVNTIIEEFIHLKYGVQDCTRGFQTAAISELITYMKERSSYAL